MSIWFTADLHLGHTAMVGDGGWRGYATLDDMHVAIARRWNARVAPGDTVYILGDLVMGQRDSTLPLLDALNGFKVAVWGNHDHVHPMHEDKMRARWRSRYMRHVQVELASPMIDIGAPDDVVPTWVQVSHFPFSGDHTAADRYTDWRPKAMHNTVALLHGHCHGALGQVHVQREVVCIDVGLDAWDLHPLHIDIIRDIVQQAKSTTTPILTVSAPPHPPTR